jgi:hypothetical protein
MMVVYGCSTVEAPTPSADAVAGGAPTAGWLPSGVLDDLPDQTLGLPTPRPVNPLPAPASRTRTHCEG